jgi:hypothetical protein
LPNHQRRTQSDQPANTKLRWMPSERRFELQSNDGRRQPIAPKLRTTIRDDGLVTTESLRSFHGPETLAHAYPEIVGTGAIPLGDCLPSSSLRTMPHDMIERPLPGGSERSSDTSPWLGNATPVPPVSTRSSAPSLLGMGSASMQWSQSSAALPLTEAALAAHTHISSASALGAPDLTVAKWGVVPFAAPAPTRTSQVGSERGTAR